jgi:hypothetical protein
MDSYYPFGIFKLFSQSYDIRQHISFLVENIIQYDSKT